MSNQPSQSQISLVKAFVTEWVSLEAFGGDEQQFSIARDALVTALCPINDGLKTSVVEQNINRRNWLRNFADGLAANLRQVPVTERSRC